MVDSTKICLVIGAILLIALVIYFFKNRKESFSVKKESYKGAINTSLDSRYELIQSSDASVPADHFADLVDSGDSRSSRRSSDSSESCHERLEKLQGRSLLPMTAAHLPQYSINMCNPSIYSFSVKSPHVTLKNRLKMQADPLRGDIPIGHHPNVPMVSRSQYGNESWRGDGFFSASLASLKNPLDCC